MKIFGFDQLPTASLVVDAVYEGGSLGNLSSEVISKLLSVEDEKGQILKVHNAGGFRYRGSLPNPSVVALTSNSSEPAWPDNINPFVGQLTYFGDNRSPGELHETNLSGNQILADSFARFKNGSVERESLPVFFYFTKWSGFSQQFRGLVVPGGIGVTADDQLNAIWRTKNGSRFQNYRALFTVLNIPEISRVWISDLLLGKDKLLNAPDNYKKWVATGKYEPLVSENVVQVRTKEEQLPQDDTGLKLVAHIHKRFEDKPHDFEPVALALWGLLSKLPMDAEVTRQAVDGGRDAFGVVRVGPISDPLKLDFALEAKCYGLNNSVGVKETSRLISRLRRHHFGVLVTTSFIGKQAYEELREDGHPVVLMTGADIASVLQANGHDNVNKLDVWIDTVL
jgi:Restriction endonuclease AspBHI N-terminal/Restriction endonuclease